MITNQIMKRSLAYFIVTGKHEHQLRNEYGTEEKQKEYFELEKQVAMLIEEDFLKDPDSVVGYLRNKFQKNTFRQ